MAEPNYRWGDPPPAAVKYRRQLAQERQHKATANWHRSQRAKQKLQQVGYEISTRAQHPELPDRQTAEPTSCAPL